VISNSALSLAEQKVFKDMLIMDQLRGKDSTGIFTVDGKGEVNYQKSVVHPADFLTLPKVVSAMTNAVAMVGHNRHATMGAVNANNAHPFQHSFITLVHNGTLDRWPALPHQSEYQTDSECVAYNLSLCRSDADTVKFLETVSGAFTFVWYDDAEQAMYYIRNDERPLYSVKVAGTQFFASERGFLFAALDRAGVKIDTLDVFSDVPVGVLHKVTKKNNKLVTEEIKVKLQEPVVMSNYGNSYKQSKSNQQYYISELEDELGIKPGTTLLGYVESSEQHSQYAGTVVVRLQDNGHDSKVVVYNLHNAHDYVKGDKVRVVVQSLNNLHFKNHTAKSTSELTLRGSQVWKTVTHLPVVTSPKSVTESESTDDTDADEQVVCCNCDSVHWASASTELNDGTYMCDSCMSHDPQAQAYAIQRLA
jgi:hypothetical protein